MKDKDYQEFMEKEALRWTVQYGDCVYILTLDKVKKRWIFKVLTVPKNKISFKKKRLEAIDEHVYQGKEIAVVKAKMMADAIFMKRAFNDIYNDILIIDKGY